MAKESIIKGLYTQFNKTELLDTAKELDLTVDPKAMSNRQISKAIIEDLDANGVPEVEDCSDMLLELLHVAEYIDENGELIEEVEEEEDTEPIVEHIEEEPEAIALPVCFSFADERDPACNKCRVKTICLQARVENRPPCFGKYFDENSIECQGCMEAPKCKPLSLQED